MQRNIIENENYTTRISWGSIIAGALSAIVVGSLLNLLGMGVGLINFNPAQSEATTLGTGTIVWLVLSTVAYSILGGWIAARYTHYNTNKVYLLNGFLAWSLATIFTLFFITSSAGFFMNAGVHAVSGNLAQVTGMTQRNSPASTGSPQVNIQQAANQVVGDDAARNALVDKASDVLGSVALITFVILFLGALSSLLGAYLGAQQRYRASEVR